MWLCAVGWGVDVFSGERRGSVWVYDAGAIHEVALGGAVLCSVLAGRWGFQAAFRERVLGVNAHLLVLKYGWDFTEYRDVIQRARATPGVVGASPFLTNPMMITSWPLYNTDPADEPRRATC